MKRSVYIEVSTLFEPAWSGIANVTANLCRFMLSNLEDVSFFAFDKLVKREYVINALETSDGAGLWILFEQGPAVAGNLVNRPRGKKKEVAIFPNFKRATQQFEREIMIVHDLSFILTPELHEEHLIRVYLENIYRDAHAVNHVVCVSNATRRDLIKYYNVASSKVTVSHLGVTKVALAEEKDAGLLHGFGLIKEKYFLVLGTIEPRKNIALILDYLKGRPHILNQYKFVFAGRDGWGPTFAALCRARGLPPSDPRIVRLGYVTEAQRVALLRNCAALIFPSWFEGFGLPVIEAMALGTPVIGSRSSGICEAGGDAMIGFDPSSIDSFVEAMERRINSDPEQSAALKRVSRNHAAMFTWEAFGHRICKEF